MTRLCNQTTSPFFGKMLAGLAMLLGLLALPQTGRAQSGPTARPDTVFTTQPVELVHFAAFQYFNGGQLHWVTLREANSVRFEVQQSSNGRNWTLLATMVANPNRTTRQDYVYYDVNLRRYGIPVIYYRLRKNAQDGSFTYSPVRAIRLDDPAAIR